MDLFSRNRTFLVIFFLLALFTIFFVQFFFPFRKESFLLEEKYPNEWKEGAPIYIRSKFLDNPLRYNVEKKPLYGSSSHNPARCNTQCMNQTECQDKGPNWKNTCKMEMTDRCYCQFSRVDKNKEGFSDLQDILRVFPNVPIWKDANSENKWHPITKQTDLVRWSDLKKRAESIDRTLNISNISFSFWVYFDEALGRNRPLTSIFQIANGDYNGDRNWRGRDRYLAVFAYPERPTLHIRTMRHKNINAGGREFSLENDDYGGNEIGYNHLPSFVCVVVSNNQIKLYVDGEEQNKFGVGYLSPPPDDAKIMSGITYAPYNGEPKGISIRDFFIYGESLKEFNIKAIYKYQKNTVLAARGWDQGNVEEFSLMGSLRNFFKSDLNQESFLSGEQPPAINTDSTLAEQAPDDFFKSFDNAAAVDKDDNVQYRYRDAKEFHENRDSIISQSRSITINKTSITTEYAKLRSNIGNSCYRNYNEEKSSNFQDHPQWKTYEVMNVKQEISPYKTPPILLDKTNLFRAVMKEYSEGRQVTLNKDFQLDRPFKLHIQMPRNWQPNNNMPLYSKGTVITQQKDSNSITFEYKPGQENTFFTEVANTVQCYNRVDHFWDQGAKQCKPYHWAGTCGPSAPKCINNIAWVKMGRCSADGNENDFEKYEEEVQVADMSMRKLSYVDLNEKKGEYLDLVVPSTIEKDVMFSQEGTTFSMWFKVEPGMRKRTRQWFRLVDFGNRSWWRIRDDIIIAIDGDNTKSRLICGASVNGRNHWAWNLASQVLDNKWHHIAWVLVPEKGSEPAHWIIYHQGKPLGRRRRPYPENKERNTKHVGGPAVHWDPSFGPSIADFRIDKGVLNHAQIWKLYSHGV